MTNTKILHVAYAGLGGHANVFFVMAENSPKQITHEIIFQGIEPIRLEYEEKCKKLNIPYSYVNKKKGLDISYYISIHKHIKKSDADIVFLHGGGLIFPAFFSFKKIIVRETQANHLKTTFNWVFLFFSFLLANKVVLLSENYLKELKIKFNFLTTKNNQTIIPNGLDLVKFVPINGNRSEQEICIGMQSRLVAIKDHSTLIKAIACLKNKAYYSKIKLKIAGDGDTLQNLKGVVKNLELQNHVSFLGMLDEDALISFLQNLDIYVHATYGETMSNAIMQAQACGLPIIASDVLGVNNVIKHAVNGLLVPLKNEQVMAETISNLISHPEELLRLSKASRKYAEQNLSSQKMINSYIELFKEVLE